MSKKSRFLQDDNTEKVYSSPRQEGTFLYFTGTGDTPDIVGGGSTFLLRNEDSLDYKDKVLSFNENVFLKDGFVFWENAKPGDSASLEIILPKDTPYVSVTQQGNAGVTDDQGTISYITDSSTPDETWIGTHILFPIDVVLFRFVNKFSLIGSNTNGILLPSPDVAEVESSLNFKISFESPTKNPDLVVSILIEMYRKNTV